MLDASKLAARWGLLGTGVPAAHEGVAGDGSACRARGVLGILSKLCEICPISWAYLGEICFLPKNHLILGIFHIFCYVPNILGIFQKKS